MGNRPEIIQRAPAVIEGKMTQEEAEQIAKQHVDLAQSVVGWFGFDRRKEITWGPDYNQAARDIYVKACKLIGVDPHPAE